MFLPNSMISDVILVAYNQLWWEYLYHGNWTNITNQGFPPFLEILLLKI